MAAFGVAAHVCVCTLEFVLRSDGKAVGDHGLMWDICCAVLLYVYLGMYCVNVREMAGQVV